MIRSINEGWVHYAYLIKVMYKLSVPFEDRMSIKDFHDFCQRTNIHKQRRWYVNGKN